MSTAYYSCPNTIVRTLTYQNVIGLGEYQGDMYFLSLDTSKSIPSQFVQITLTEAIATVLRLQPFCPVKYILTVQESQNQAIALLQEAMWVQIFQGFNFTSTASSMSFNVSIKSAQDIVNINGLATLGIAMKQNLSSDSSFPLIYIDSSGGIHNPTPDDAISLGHQCGQFVINSYNWFAPLQTQVLQATDIDSVNAILTGNGLQSLYS